MTEKQKSPNQGGLQATSIIFISMSTWEKVNQSLPGKTPVCTNYIDSRVFALDSVP